MNLAPLASVDADGRVTAAAVASARVEQTVPDAYATRGHFLAGRYTFTFARRYANPPVCIASSEGAAPVRVRSTPASCSVFSAQPNDTSIVNVQVTGDPN